MLFSLRVLRNRRKGFLPLACLVVAHALSVPSDAATSSGSTHLGPAFFGLDVELDNQTPSPNSVGLTGQQLHRLWLAGGGLWADIESKGRGEFNWAFLDSYVDKAGAHGQLVSYVIAMTPAFAVAPEKRSSFCAFGDLYPGGCNPPDDWNKSGFERCKQPAENYFGPNCVLKEFVSALVRRYRSTGVQEGCLESNPQCHGVINYYEFWNEVDSYQWPSNRFWAGSAIEGNPDSRENAFHILVAMLADASEVIRREDPGARIIGPSFQGAESAPDFEFFYSQEPGPDQFVDILSFHGYFSTWQAHGAEKIRDLIQSYENARERASKIHPGLNAKPFWDTEGSWGENFSFGRTCDQDWASCLQDPDKQEAYLARWFLHHWDMGIENATWFHWGTNGWGEFLCPNGSKSEDHKVGCERLNTENPQLTHAGRAYQELTQWLGGSYRVQSCQKDGSDWACEILNSEFPLGRGLILWNEMESEREIQVPNEFVGFKTLQGTRGAVLNLKVLVGSKPILVF